VIDTPTYNRLQDIIRREGRSFLQYAVESTPWSSTEADGRTAVLQQLARDEGDAAGGLARLLLRHRLSPPYLGAYPMGFTSYNYLALDRLVTLLADHQRRGLPALQDDLAALEDPEIRDAVRHLLEVKKANLKKLEALLQPGTEPAASPP
jgi:hypothetical protein